MINLLICISGLNEILIHSFPGNCLSDNALPSQINGFDRLLDNLLRRSSLQPFNAHLPHLTPRWHLWWEGKAARGGDNPVQEQEELWGNREGSLRCGRGFPRRDFGDRGGSLEVTSFKNLSIQIIFIYSGGIFKWYPRKSKSVENRPRYTLKGVPVKKITLYMSRWGELNGTEVGRQGEVGEGTSIDFEEPVVITIQCDGDGWVMQVSPFP